MAITYSSKFKKLKDVFLPGFDTDRFIPNTVFNYTRVLMLPILMEDIESLPNDLAHYKQTVLELVELSPVKEGVAYLTIDEKFVKKGDTLRKKGLHVDGIGSEDRSANGVWATSGIQSYIVSMWDEGAKKWHQGAAAIGGMLTVSNPAGCRAWDKDFTGRIGYNGCCEHIRHVFPDAEATVFEAGVAYWCNAACVHESLPVDKDMERTFVRLSMPSNAPWYSGYTKNPKGIQPTGIVVPSHIGMRHSEPEVILKG